MTHESRADPDPLLPPTRFRQHVLNRTIVLREFKLLFLPIPKTGCTSLLWWLAELAGLSPHAFTASTTPEVMPALTIHDVTLWDGAQLLGALTEEDRDRALTQDGWLRFTIVREPAARLWSAWQSKLLLREPRFAHDFGSEPWFPAEPTDPQAVLADFRKFIAALGPDGPVDVHWAAQHELAGALPLNHIGRLERLDETLARLADHLPDRVLPTHGLGQENRAMLPMPPSAYDVDSAAHVNELYATDFSEFGYAPVTPEGGDDDWSRRVAPLLPAARAVILRHERIGALSRVASSATTQAGDVDALRSRVKELESALYAATARPRGLAGKAAVVNREGAHDFDIRWNWARDEALEPGFTAVIRAKNEAGWLPWVLPSLLRAVPRVVLVDNNSTDGTADVARTVAASVGAADRLDVHTYPFAISRCGPEHLGTPPDSVHSLTYYNNWAFAHARTTYALKWDGDMVMTEAGIRAVSDLAWQTETGDFLVLMPHYPMYVVDDRTAFVDVALGNPEFYGWPNARGYEHMKAFEWELSSWPRPFRTLSLPHWSCVELKHLSADEFSHWSVDNFDATRRTTRKQREMQVFRALAEQQEPPLGVVRIDAADARNVIEYARAEWIPAHQPELIKLRRDVRDRLGPTWRR